MTIKNKLRTSSVLTILIIIDQLSKHFFYDKLFLNDLSIIQPVFNAGISRSIPIPQVVVIVLTFLILWLLVYLYYKKQISKWSTIFLIWWAVSNLIDRVFLWWVRDFILLFKRFPIFNLADVFINTGVVLIVLKELFGIWQKYSWKRKNY